ncbi:MAG: P-II family nitrogen regulator, partial [Acutalibacteraceae bacterium]
MYKIGIIARPDGLDDLTAALDGIGINGLTISDVDGYGIQKGHTSYYRGVKREIKFKPKVRITTVIEKNMVEKVLALITETLRTGKYGDGKVFVSEICDALRVRTGERGIDALRDNDE